MTPDNETSPDQTPAEQALSRFLEGEAEPGDGAVLAAAMEKDPSFAALVRRLLAVDDMLRQVHEPDGNAFTASVQARLVAEEDGDAFTRTIFDQLDEPAGSAAGTLPRAIGAATRRAAPRRSAWFRERRSWMAAAAVLLAAAGGWWLGHAHPILNGRKAGAEVAWLTNAQNCCWTKGSEPDGDLLPGKILQLEQGLAELSFPKGARVVLQGPAALVLQSAAVVRLLHGRLTARVPDSARGFEVLSPEGKVVDLGTEFGLNVTGDGSAQVYVFRGEVLAESAGKAFAAAVCVKQEQSARISFDGIALKPGVPDTVPFVRAIVPPSRIVPRTLSLDFRHAVADTLQDVDGLGTGLTHRLPGTGGALPARDPQLRLERESGVLKVTTTESDLNGQLKLSHGEYPGVRLADLGFTGREDFSVSAVLPHIPTLETADQIGLYAGVRSDRNIRGGLHRPGTRSGEGSARQFFVQNHGGLDSHLYMVGLVSIGADLRLTLQRIGGKYSLTIENRTNGASSTLSIPHPEFLDKERDLFVGLFGATPWRNKPRTFIVKEFKATVWTVS